MYFQNWKKKTNSEEGNLCSTSCTKSYILKTPTLRSEILSGTELAEVSGESSAQGPKSRVLCLPG